MEDENFLTKQKQSIPEKKQSIQNPSKFYPNFLQKALIITVFFVLLPLFPSQAPEFINQTLFNRSWELFHLLFVGIAVSYGLFSRRNEEKEKENYSNVSTFDNAQSYVSRLLQVSSVFDDEAENVSGSEENKVQAWSSQYHRNEAPVVVAADQQRNSGSGFSERRLLLPIRSLKSRVLDADEEERKESFDSRSDSNLGSIRVSKIGEIGKLDKELEEKIEESVVLPSPIPWRSRSGKLEVKEEIYASPEYTPPPSTEESEINRVESRRLRSRSSRRNSNSSSPKLSPSPSMNSPRKLSPSPSKSTEFQTKKTEDVGKKKSFYLSPPPPPPPPPPMTFRSSYLKPTSSLGNNGSGNLMNRVNSGFVENQNSSTGKSKFMEFPREEKGEFGEKVMMETETDSDSDSETEDEYETGGGGGGSPGIEFSSKNEEEVDVADSSNVMDCVSDVDKKADEFIAKIREQIRLQRIDSIKRSSGQMKRSISSR